ncbi:MAG: metal-dependent hydrolase [Micromonosporaceae bacterium]|nr:metal-dependent hydrolase [Micromonosporaceae bacterium]
MAAGLLAGASGPAAAAPDSPQAPERPLRVMCFNIHHGVGVDGRLDLERIAQLVEQQEAEVVGLQEVDRHFSSRSDFVDQAQWLARRLQMHVVYGANLSYAPLQPGAPRREYGTAVLSRHPILEWSNTFLPMRPGAEQRGLLHALVTVRGVPVRIYNTHLQHTSTAERMAQVTRIRELIGDPDESVILVGDLNATPEAPEIIEITKDLSDTWLDAGVGPGHTYDAESPHARIDYVLSSDDVVARSAAVIASESSDHLPVVVDVALPGSKVGVALGAR